MYWSTVTIVYKKIYNLPASLASRQVLAVHSARPAMLSQCQCQPGTGRTHLGPSDTIAGPIGPWTVGAMEAPILWEFLSTWNIENNELRYYCSCFNCMEFLVYQFFTRYGLCRMHCLWITTFHLFSVKTK